MSARITLTGIDGSNPLGFLAALGVLNIAADHDPAATVAWHAADWRPLLETEVADSRETLVARIVEDLASWRDDPCLDLKYVKGRNKTAWDLKPPPAQFRAYARRLTEASTAGLRRAVDFASAFGTESAQDNNGNTKPTALHFTAGQQQFLEMVAQLRDGVTVDDFAEALWGPWRYERTLPVLGWDCTASRAYALRADDPSKAEKRGVPGADWLAFRGLSFIRVSPQGKQIATTGCSGGWKTGRFTWPLWEVPVRRDTVQALLQLSNLDELSADERQARGVSMVFASRIRRSDQGGYGSFLPAAVV